MSDPSDTLRTAIYIDGYNLYYGRLRGTRYKWLDVVALFSQMVRSIEPTSQIISVKYFTAPALTKFARHGEASMRAQNDYHRALESKYPEVFMKVLGTHVYEKNGTALPIYQDGQAFDKTKTVKVWRLVEKKPTSISPWACTGMPTKAWLTNWSWFPMTRMQSLCWRP